MHVNTKKGVITFKSEAVERRRVDEYIDLVDTIERNIRDRDPVRHALVVSALETARQIAKMIAKPPKEEDRPLFDQASQQGAAGSDAVDRSKQTESSVATPSTGESATGESSGAPSASTAASGGDVSPAGSVPPDGGSQSSGESSTSTNKPGESTKKRDKARAT